MFNIEQAQISSLCCDSYLLLRVSIVNKFLVGVRACWEKEAWPYVFVAGMQFVNNRDLTPPFCGLDPGPEDGRFPAHRTR